MTGAKRMRALLVPAGAVAVLLAGCGASGGAGGTSAASSTAATGDASAASAAVQPCPTQPDRPAHGDQVLPAMRFDCLGGGTLDLGRAPGRPTVVNLWASWCGPCREELPLMQQLAVAGAGKLQVIGVVSKDGRPQALSFAADAGATFPSAFDEQGDLMTKLGLRGLPYTYLLDASGAVVYTQVGQVTSEDQLRQLVADHLGVHL